LLADLVPGSQQFRSTRAFRLAQRKIWPEYFL
jgi:hypothetical protein